MTDFHPYNADATLAFSPLFAFARQRAPLTLGLSIANNQLLNRYPLYAVKSQQRLLERYVRHNLTGSAYTDRLIPKNGETIGDASIKSGREALSLAE